MIGSLLLSLGVCFTPEPALPIPVVQTLLGVYRAADSEKVADPDDPYALIVGTQRPDLPVTPTEPGEPVTYKVWADPVYDPYCFEETVDRTLSDPRSWPNIVKAAPDETPQFWVTLVAPAAACGTSRNPRASCTWNNGDGTGIITINAMRWSRGYGDGDKGRTTVLVHEVGHILQVGHSSCSVMGAPRWTPAAGYPRYHNEWTHCTKIPAWPHEGLRELSTRTYQAWFSQ